jgi:hypothetical protein
VTSITRIQPALVGARRHLHGDTGGAFAAALADSTRVLVALVAVGAVLTWALVRRSGGDEPAAEEHPEHRLERHRLHL